jgi:hypothetical protein
MSNDPTGVSVEKHGGKSYEMRLTMRDIAALQAKHGNTIAGLVDGSAGNIPAFAPLLDIVEAGLNRAGVSDDDLEDIADDMLRADKEIVGRLILTAFPEVNAGNVKRPKKAA